MPGRAVSAWLSIASRTPIAALSGAQLGSTTRSYWYHATPTWPPAPAVIHGQLTVTPGCATTTGRLQCRPPSRDDVSITLLATGVGSPSQPPDEDPCLRSSVVQVR